MTLKKRALRRTKTLRRDPETQEILPPSKLSVWKSRLQAPFTRSFWEECFERSDDETLVDGKLLSYAYLEAGLIEMVGALVAYFVVFWKSGFSPSDLRRAQTVGSTSHTGRHPSLQLTMCLCSVLREAQPRLHQRSWSGHRCRETS